VSERELGFGYLCCVSIYQVKTKTFENFVKTPFLVFVLSVWEEHVDDLLEHTIAQRRLFFDRTQYISKSGIRSSALNDNALCCAQVSAFSAHFGRCAALEEVLNGKLLVFCDHS
jgi:hypothetical protein